MDKDAIGPIRSFSGSPETTELLRGAQYPSVRTRGPIRNRISPAEDKRHLLTVETLFKQIRAEVNGLPLTIIIHGWGDKAAEDFRFLSLRLLMRDALWFIPSRNRRVTRAAPAKEGAVILELDSQIDQRIYNNLVGDVVFFPAREYEEVPAAAAFHSRARAMVIDNRENQQNTIKLSIVQAAVQAGTNLYLWLGGDALAECASVADLDATFDTNEIIEKIVEDLTDPSISEALARIGNVLKELADHLEDEFDQRFIFRLYLEEIFEAYPGHATWDKDLVKLAHEYGWPPWAIESLPRLYVVEHELPEGRARALVWDSILECVPEHYAYERLGELCNGQFIEVEMSVEARLFIEMIVNVLGERLRGLPFASERAFYGEINQALLDLSLKVNDSAAKEKIEQARVKFTPLRPS